MPLSNGQVQAGWAVWVTLKLGQERPAIPNGYTRLRPQDNGDLRVDCPDEPFARSLASDLNQAGYDARAAEYFNLSYPSVPGHKGYTEY